MKIIFDLMVKKPWGKLLIGGDFNCVINGSSDRSPLSQKYIHQHQVELSYRWNGTVRAPDSSQSIDPVSLIPVITNFRPKKCLPAHTTRAISSNLIHITYSHKQSMQSITPAKFALFNARSLSNRSFILNDLITSHNLDFLILTEKWLKTGDCCHLIELCPPE